MQKEQYPSQYESWLTLKNGRKVFLRPVLQTDKELLVDLFDKMSPKSRYLRFMSNISALPEELLYHFTHVDYASEFALVGIAAEQGKDAIIAVGRYSLGEDKAADLGVAVRDDWQHMGIGRFLLAKIIEIGKEHGISRYSSMMEYNNDIMKKTIGELGLEVTYRFRDGVYQVQIVA